MLCVIMLRMFCMLRLASLIGLSDKHTARRAQNRAYADRNQQDC